MEDWRGVDFPKDGREVMLQLNLSVPAYYDKDLGCWVLINPLMIESVHRPSAWKHIRKPEVVGSA